MNKVWLMMNNTMLLNYKYHEVWLKILHSYSSFPLQYFQMIKSFSVPTMQKDINTLKIGDSVNENRYLIMELSCSYKTWNMSLRTEYSTTHYCHLSGHWFSSSLIFLLVQLMTLMCLICTFEFLCALLNYLLSSNQ
jgi:hypothetical protein